MRTATLRKDPPKGEAPRPATESVDLSLQLLERLALSAEPIGVSDLAREFGSSKATVYRHLCTLASHGVVAQDSTTLRYTAGIKLLILGERLRERFSVLNVARGEMARLRDETGHAVSLSTLMQDQVVWLEVFQGHAIVNFGTQPGRVLDLHATAHGKIALAFGPKGLLERCVAKPLKSRTPFTITAPGALERAVAHVKARGWATAPNEFALGINGIAAPVFSHTGDYA